MIEAVNVWDQYAGGCLAAARPQAQDRPRCEREHAERDRLELPESGGAVQRPRLRRAQRVAEPGLRLKVLHDRRCLSNALTSCVWQRGCTVVALLPALLHAEWWHTLVMRADALFYLIRAGRVGPHTCAVSAARASSAPTR